MQINYKLIAFKLKRERENGKKEANRIEEQRMN